MKNLLLFIILLTLTISCTPRFVPIKTVCPSHPRMAPVRVINHEIKGTEVDNVIDNFNKLWKHIHLVEKLGCST